MKRLIALLIAAVVVAATAEAQGASACAGLKPASLKAKASPPAPPWP